MENPSIFFIDDEPRVLNAVRRMLRLSHRDWEMHFFNSPDQALEALKSISPWVVVADKHLAHMDGVELLQKVAEVLPEALRILLTGDARLNSAVQATAAAHFIMRKPFEQETIENVLTKARVLHQLPISLHRRQQMGQLNGLPVLPKVYQRITQELESKEPDVANVAALIREDQSLLSKILQLVNSPFFGFSSRTQEIEVAVMRLGLETIHNLVLIAELYHQGPSRLLKVGDRLMREALLLAEQVCVVCDLHRVSKPVKNLAIISALLHNVGQLVLELHVEKNLAEAPTDLHEASVVGAYLLELWGFDPEVVEAVQHQCDDELPGECEPVSEMLNLALKMRHGGFDNEQIVQMVPNG
ncbi:HDOD domain-containing protein [Marinobacterium sediminicola]|uniref:HD-like signal output (HDOD) domain, no enzymatic activity n=1 Tax=Marinobacterium sediminicola TaxID=518898 RepID=A0ABY1RYT8_9GAMM|nr:HDOD domain-containing protein [Marinobacterium sediminicola]ULG67996.1 response regulator [Marinobacterium sediminicola]SMR73494.1 HD-like signal output (HDOD) domain, no enzymatic activity [Marinobacterium sediminicola]